MTHSVFCFSQDGAAYLPAYGAEDHDAALAVAIAHFKPKPGAELWTAVAEGRTFADYVDAADIAQAASMNAENDVGEFSAGWPPEIPERAALELHYLLDAWATRNGLQPQWNGICDKRRHVVPAAQQQEDA